MADCTEISLDNNLYEKSMTYTLEKICKILDCKYKQESEYILNKHDQDKYIINVGVNCHYSIDTYFEENGYVEIYIGDQGLIFSKYSINLYHSSMFDFCFEWHNFMSLLHGEYDQEYNNYCKYILNEIKYFSKLFESTQMIIYNENNSNIEIKLSNNEKIENIVKEEKSNLITELSIPKCDMEYNDLDYIYYENWINNEIIGAVQEVTLRQRFLFV